MFVHLGEDVERTGFGVAVADTHPSYGYVLNRVIILQRKQNTLI